MTRKELINTLENRKDRSAWDKGVTLYAIELIESMYDVDDEEELVKNENICKQILLNGANDWSQYSYGGSSLVYDCDIAERLCCPSELKKVCGGDRNPNRYETWLDVQARALNQACNRIMKLLYVRGR